MTVIGEVVDLCNENDGFISAILAIIALVISIKLARLPYQQKVSFHSYLDESKSGNLVLVLYVTNIGNCPIYVDELIAKEGKKTIGRCTKITCIDNNILEPQRCYKYRIVLTGYNIEDLDKYETLNVKLISKKKSFKYQTNWAMG